MCGRSGHNTRPHTRLPSSFLVTDNLKTECSFGLQATCVIGVPGLFFDMLFMSACTTRYWQTSGRLVQVLNECTVHIQTKQIKKKESTIWEYTHCICVLTDISVSMQCPCIGKHIYNLVLKSEFEILNLEFRFTSKLWTPIGRNRQ